MAKRGTVGWKLPEAERNRLLDQFRPAYSDIIADHVTLATGVSKDQPRPGATSARVVGIADDGHGVQALVVEIGGTTDRPDGSTYHITWSLDHAAGRRPVESNDVIARCGWTPVDPVTIALEPWFKPN